MFERITPEEIEECFDRGVKDGQRYLVIYNDSFDYDYYPVFFKDAESFWDANEEYINNSSKYWTSIEEVYDLSMDKEFQLSEDRARHFPPDTRKAK
jgi:hypothetical protein